MFRIYNTDTETVIRGVHYPKNSILFDIVETNTIHVYTLDKRLDVVNLYSEYADINGIQYDSVDEVIDELKKNHRSLELDVEQINVNTDEIEGKLDTVNDTLQDILTALGGGSGNTSVSHSVIKANTSQVSLLASNSNRKSVIIYNNSNDTLFIKYATGVSDSSFTYKLFKEDVVIIDDSEGPIYGIWNGTNGNAQITEVTKV